MAVPCHSALFEKAITVTPIDSTTYSANLDTQWRIGKVPHGGYLTSILYRVATVHFKNNHSHRFQQIPELIGLQVSFLRRTAVGPAILKVQDVKIGARISTIHVTLLQKPEKDNNNTNKANADVDVDVELEPKFVAYINVSPPEMEQGTIYNGPWSISPPAPSGSLPDGSIDFAALVKNGKDGPWIKIPPPSPTLIAAQHFDLYAPRPKLPRTLETRSQQVVDQWVRFTPGGNSGSRWSNEAVMFLIDMFPLALDRMGAMEISRVLALEEKDQENGAKIGGASKGPFWFPTVTLNIDLKARLPPQGVEWLYMRVVTRMLRDGRTDLDIVVLDQNGELVATSTHVVLVVDSSRNSKGRVDSEKL